MDTVIAQQIWTLFKKHQNEFYRFAYSLVRNQEDAEDVVQLSLEKLAKQANGKGCLPGQAKGYVFQCIKNSAIDLFRRKKTLMKAEVEIKYILNRQISTHEHALLTECFDLLPENHKEAIMLKEIMGFTYSEIGKIKGVSLFTAASWYRRGMKQLGNLIVKDQLNEE